MKIGDKVLQRYNGRLVEVTFIGATNHPNLVRIEDEHGTPRLVNKHELRENTKPSARIRSVA